MLGGTWRQERNCRRRMIVQLRQKVHSTQHRTKVLPIPTLEITRTAELLVWYNTTGLSFSLRFSIELFYCDVQYTMTVVVKKASGKETKETGEGFTPFVTFFCCHHFHHRWNE